MREAVPVIVGFVVGLLSLFVIALLGSDLGHAGPEARARWAWAGGPIAPLLALTIGVAAGWLVSRQMKRPSQ